MVHNRDVTFVMLFLSRAVGLIQMAFAGRSHRPELVFARRTGAVPVSALLLLLAATLCAGAIGVWHWRVHDRTVLHDLERQLALARHEGDAESVSEIARRIARMDDSPARLLALAECQLQLGLFDELEQTLAQVLRAAPDCGAAVARLHARAAAARNELEASLRLWEEYLAGPKVPTVDRVSALDEVIAILIQQSNWERTRLRIDERLALADAVPARLARVHCEIRLRQWAAVREDFEHLEHSAPADAAVKECRPAWERVERALSQLSAEDAAVNAAPTGLRVRLERALVSAQLGLWQNSADDLQQAAIAYPSARMPGMFGALIRGIARVSWASAPSDAEIAALPWLASTEVLGGFHDRLDPRSSEWRALLTLDEQLATRSSADDEGEKRCAARAERARLICVLGWPQAALVEAEEIEKSQPDFRPARRVAIAALLESGELGKAAREVERLIRLDTGESGRTDGELQRLAGLVWQAQGQHARAVEALTAALAGPPRADLLRARAKSLRQLQRFAEATQDLAAADALEAKAMKEEGQ